MASDQIVIPRVCPSCMKPADRELRYAYNHCWGTFYYCTPCCAEFRRRGNTLRIIVWTSLLLWIPGALALAFALDLSGVPILVLAGALPLVASVAVWLLRRRPLPAGMVSSGFAAYYTGKQRLGVGMKLRDEYTFIALRDEWLDALIDANPYATDPDEYLRRRGVQRPIPA